MAGSVFQNKKKKGKSRLNYYCGYARKVVIVCAVYLVISTRIKVVEAYN